MFSPISLALALIVAAKAHAHGGVLHYSYGVKWWTGWQPYDSPVGQTSIQRPWSTYNPITSATDPALSCNDDGNSGALQLTAPVAAGSAITAYWNQVWPHPYGPMLTYLARCPESGCTGVNSNGLKWFKIDEAGLLSGTVASGTWGAGKMIAQNNSWTTTIPSTVPGGNYLIRFETIALHSLPAQMYPECAQIWILGGGSRDPTSDELVTFPGGYSDSDPGLTVDLYGLAAQTMTTYPIPGPPLYGSSRSTGGPVTVPSTPVSTPTPAPTAGTVAHYGQCGGNAWTGATDCTAPCTCTVLNPYYSQCL